MPPVAHVERDVYVHHSVERGAPVLSMRYLGKGLRREESRGYEVASDWSEGHRVRASEDNGRTWSDWREETLTWPVKDGMSREEGAFATCYDPVSEQIVRFVFRRLLIGEGAEAIQTHFRTGGQTMFDHNHWQVSEDEGRTWGKPTQLQYEHGAAFNPDNWADEAYLRTNQMYGGYVAIATREGTIVYPSAGIPMEIMDRGQPEIAHGVHCFIGTWDRGRSDYDWEVSEPVAVPHRISGRGLAEPTVAELADGRLFMEMRGSTVAVEPEWKGKTEAPGRRWFSLSKDGGRTWSPVTDLRYETGETFYSPSTFASLLRHSRNGKLYWVGNITPKPPAGNLPRYPLYLAEVEESIPALRRDTLTLIDDYDPDSDSPAVQFSNFSLFENRETGELELYLTRYGENKSHWLHADAYRYTITLDAV